MDTSILHTKCREYQAKAKHPMQKEMIGYFLNWLYAIENYLSDIELDNVNLNNIIATQNQVIDQLIKLLIITGNADKLTLNLSEEETQKAIDLLLKSKDRVNHQTISDIKMLLYLADIDKVEISNIKELKDYATGR